MLFRSLLARDQRPTRAVRKTYLHRGFTNVFDFEPFLNVRRWLDDMKQVAGHDDAHVVMTELGDISVEAPAMDAIKQANLRAMGAVKKRVAEMVK